MFELKTVMDDTASFVNRETHIYVAMNLLVKENLPGLPVINDNNHPVGVLADRALLKALTAEEITDNKTVADYMSLDFKVFDVDDSAVDVCEFFIKDPTCTMVLVTEKGSYVGVVSRRDILFLILKIRGKIYQKNKG